MNRPEGLAMHSNARLWQDVGTLITIGAHLRFSHRGGISDRSAFTAEGLVARTELISGEISNGMI